jgi:hypothetical protein
MQALSLILGQDMIYRLFKMWLTYPEASIGVEQCGARIRHTFCRRLIIYLQPCMSLAAVCY